MKTWFAAVAAFITFGLALAACGSSAHPAAGSAGPTQDASGRSELEAVVQCLRAHGVPDFPDPVYDPSDGRWHYADYRPAIPQSAQQACQRLDPSAVNVSASPPVPQAQFAQLVRFADCMRQHGEPTWPDPLPDGVFALPPSLMQKGNPVGVHADSACQKYLPSGHYDVIPSSS
jgi:hypothetical protein